MLETTVKEFKKFLDFVENESPKLSQKLGAFGRKDSYRLNELLCYKKDVNGPNYNQAQYPVIDLMFSLALAGGLFVRANNEKGHPALVATGAMKSYNDLSLQEKYLFLLQTYWTKYDFEYFEKQKGVSETEISHFLDLIAVAKEGHRITNDDGFLRLYSGDAPFIHHLRFFRFGEIEEIKGAKGSYEDSIKAFIPNEVGITVSGFLLTEAISLWNNPYLRHFSFDKEMNEKLGDKSAFDVFKELFDEGVVTKTVSSYNKFDRSGVYTFKVSLFKDCWRKISVSHLHTLHVLHLTIQSAFDFDNDHLYAFYVGGSIQTGKPIYCNEARDIDIEKSTEEITIEEMELFRGQKLYYLFDFGDEWKFDVDLIKIEKTDPVLLRPLIVETKGEPPEQYSW